MRWRVGLGNDSGADSNPSPQARIWSGLVLAPQCPPLIKPLTQELLCLPRHASSPLSRRSDARLHKDDVDICFSKTLNSCKVPQIRYASVERLLERLTDLRFLSIDFLNTFLHTYRLFTTAAVVMDKLADIYKKPFTSIPVRSAQGEGRGAEKLRRNTSGSSDLASFCVLYVLYICITDQHHQDMAVVITKVYGAFSYVLTA